MTEEAEKNIVESEVKMSEYGQELREFVIGCPSGAVVAQKLMAKITEAAGRYDKLESQRDDLLAACELGALLYEKYFESTDDTEFQAMLGVFDLKVKDAIAKAENKK